MNLKMIVKMSKLSFQVFKLSASLVYLQQGREESVCVGTKKYNVQYKCTEKIMCLDQFRCEFAYLDRQRQNHNLEYDKKKKINE